MTKDGSQLAHRQLQALRLLKEAGVEQHVVDRIVELAIDRSHLLEFADLWTRGESALTYWVLIMSGVNQADEFRIASELLIWQEFFCGRSARVTCLQPSDARFFPMATRHISELELPVLLIGDNPMMSEHLIVMGGLLERIGAEPGKVQRFASRIHTTIQGGGSMSDIASKMRKETFWSWTKIAYDELKSLLKVSVSVKT
ncbi:MAG: hypothetical protein RMA76_35600 [Deltaproteobacteria bacterium]|jgi:hypothetical protein